MPRRERRPQECNHSGHRRSAGKLSFEAAARLRAWRSTRRGHAVDGEDPDAAGTRDRSSVFRETEMAGAIRCRRIHAAATWNLYARLVVRPTSLVPGRDPALRPNDWAGGKGTSSRARTPWSRICSTGTASSKKPGHGREDPADGRHAEPEWLRSGGARVSPGKETQLVLSASLPRDYFGGAGAFRIGGGRGASSM